MLANANPSAHHLTLPAGARDVPDSRAAAPFASQETRQLIHDLLDTIRHGHERRAGVRVSIADAHKTVADAGTAERRFRQKG